MSAGRASRLVVPANVRRETERHFRECGKGSRECLTFWTSSGTGERLRIARVIHPPHASTAVTTDLTGADVCALNMDLIAHGDRVVVQLHTHPGRAFHSQRDDELALVQTNGFLSIVVPRFAGAGILGLPECYVAEFRNGSWDAIEGDALESLIQWEA